MAPFLSIARLNNRKLPACVNVHTGFCLSVRVGETQWQSSETAAGRIDCKHSVSRRPIISLFCVRLCLKQQIPLGNSTEWLSAKMTNCGRGLGHKTGEIPTQPGRGVRVYLLVLYHSVTSTQAFDLAAMWYCVDWWNARWSESQIQHSFDSSWYISSMTVRCHMYVFWRFVQNRSVFRFVVNL